MAVNLIDSTDIEITQTGNNIQLSTTVDMQTLESNVSTNTSNITNITGTILWTNTNPTSAFASQTITLSSDDYDMLKVIYLYNLTSGLAGIQEFYKGYGTRISYMSSGNTAVQRTLTRNSDISFELSSTSGASTADNNIIPLYIMGYKTGLFD